ncbi:E3 ubiquitin-protein ligase RNF19B isoform X1 [Hippocampus zosterae]|uniref:E3 ubiquitin-protein ligase RNF19B isoform X1 n=1 Tax=Hippocampus zosterae TaxID=109293 RepID=UPI00223DCAB3|nr:E3 ubiquitin-protein ligase RNF19B isoform X1 [Hippocampus zosterae]XP_051908770.1 E3 ubiquitin-protein ligase RNF19B isoform X1 [Hippocampus zosterae]
MKRPKQQTGGPLSFLNFFSRKPKSEARPEKPAEARPKEEVAITLTLSQQLPHQDQTTKDSDDRRLSGAESSNGGAAQAEDCAAAASTASGLPAGTGPAGGADVPAADEHLEECPLCLLSQPRRRFPTLLSCPHRTCADCLRQYLRIEISESRVGIACPQCPEALAPLDVRTILDDPALLERFEEYHLRRFLAADPDTRWCPAPDCSYAVMAYGCAECPKLKCGRDGCHTEFCYHCRQLWHPNQTCDQARRQRAHQGPGGEDASALYVFSEEPGGDAEEIKPCPRCGAYIMKTNDGSCNRMNCTVCACQFCWLCMQEITDVHYLSPSGCTFWGKKPWSQTRKVLWQVGMLLGAPVVISLIAGLAIPVVIVGIPIYMGRKVHGRCKKNNISGSKHYLTVASGVMMSVFVSPVIAAVAVGVGVPLMLTYVYGVVPMSLCRNGWCRPPADAPDTLEDLAGYLLLSHMVSDHWRAQSSPTLADTSVQEVSAQEAGPALPAPPGATPGSDAAEESPKRHGGYPTREAGRSGCDGASRDGTNIEVRVEIERQPRGARQSSLSSVLSSRSLSTESLGRSANAFPVFESEDV